MAFSYFISIVPTIYVNSWSRVTLTNQYSVTEFKKELSPLIAESLPGLFFRYELEPILVNVMETRTFFLAFLVRICGIIGGVWSILAGVNTMIRYILKLFGAKHHVPSPQIT